MRQQPSKKKTVPAVRCAIYTRKSTEEGLEQEFNSLDAQRESAEAYITSQKNQGWNCLPERYDDGGFTGGNMDRPALARLLDDIKAGKVDCVVVYKVDRLSRSLLDFARIIEVFDQHHVAFVSVTQQFNTSNSMGRLVLNVLLSFAQFEREIIGERIRDKIAAQRRKGKWAGGYPILGYDVDRSGNSPKLVVNAFEAGQVQQIFNMYLKLGSLLSVVTELNRRGWCNKAWVTKKDHKPKGGNPFDKGSVYYLLTNPLYIGKVKHKTSIYDGEHEAIITPEKFLKVQAQLQHNHRTGGVEVRNRYGALLKRLIFCKKCGHTMVHTFTGRGGKRYRYYTCTKAIKSGRKSCPSGSLPAAEIEQFVIEQIRGITNDPKLRAEVLQQGRLHIDKELAERRLQIHRLDRDLSAYHTEIQRLALRNPATSETTARIVDLHERIARMETELAQLQQQTKQLEQEQLTENDVDLAFSDFDNIWNALSPREQSQLLALLVARVEFDGEDNTVAVTFHPSAIKTMANSKFEEAA